MSHNAKRYSWAPATSQVVASSRGDIGEQDRGDPFLLELMVWCQQVIHKQMTVQVGLRMSHERNKRFSGKAEGWRTWSQSAKETSSGLCCYCVYPRGSVLTGCSLPSFLKCRQITPIILEQNSQSVLRKQFCSSWCSWLRGWGSFLKDVLGGTGTCTWFLEGESYSDPEIYLGMYLWRKNTSRR